MVGVRLLGAAGLLDANGAELPLTARKRFAFLAYLAVEGSRGAPSRDEVMAVFWPDLDQRRARAVLRQTLRLLRMDLGRDLVGGRGADLSVCPTTLWCDAVAFEALLEAGSEAEAVELYRGPFLDGFHYPRASRAFEEWRDREARRLQERAVGALWRLVDDGDDRVGSERLLRLLLRTSPFDETALRWLMRSLAGRGCRAEALQLYEAFSVHLESELDAEPSPETRVLAAAVRSGAPLPPAARVPGPNGGRPRADVRPPADAPPAALRPPSPPAPPRTSVSAAPPQPSVSAAPPSRTLRPTVPPGSAPSSPRSPRRRQLAGALRASTAVVLAVLGGWLMWRTTLAPAEPVGLEASIPLMVFPFEYRGDPEHGYLAAGVAGLIGDNLDGAGPIRTIVHRWEGESSGDASTEQEPPEAVARRLGAHLFLTGEIVEAGGRLRVRAVLHGDARPGEPEARATAEGAVGELFVLADSIAASLLREAPSVGVGRPRPAALTTASLPALRAFIDGERRLRAGRYEDAIGAFEAAIREDTAFALAYHRLATAAEWAPRPDLMTWATEAAGRHADRLPLRERSLLEASLVWRRGDADEAERRLRDLLRMYPHDPETWYQLGEVLFHHNPLRGRPVRESETAWRRLLVRDPENLAARVHLARVLSAEGRLADLPADRHTSRRPGDDRDRRVLQILALQAVDSGTDQARSGMARQVRHGSDAYWVDAWYVLAFVRNLRGAEPFLDLLVEPDEPRERRVVGHVIRAHARAAQGRWEEAGRELAQASRLDPASGLVYRAYLSTLPFAPVAAPELESLRGELIRWDAGGVPVSPDPRPAFTIHAELWPILRDYLIGTTSVRLGDLSEAGARARALAEPGVGLPDVARDLAVDLSRGLEARIAAAEGRPEDALELLNGVGPRTTFERAFLSPFHARAAERHLRGELLLAVGRDEEALPWFDSAAQLSPYELVFLPFAHLARARIHERSGEDEAARRHFLAYRTLWSRADHAWRDAVERELRGEAVEARR